MNIPNQSKVGDFFLTKNILKIVSLKKLGCTISASCSLLPGNMFVFLEGIQDLGYLSTWDDRAPLNIPFLHFPHLKCNQNKSYDQNAKIQVFVPRGQKK